MKLRIRSIISLLAAAAVFSTTNLVWAQYAVEVTSYDAGTTPAIDFESGLPYNITSTALGEPSRFTNDAFFPGVVSPFSAPYKRGQLLSVGETGHVTLRLSNYALPQPGGKEIGVFAHAGLIDIGFPAGQAGDPASVFGVDSAFVEVSADGTNWFAIGDTTFDIPTNGYSDVTDPFAGSPGSVPSDFQKPFLGSLASFDGLPHSDAGGPDILEVLDGSGGGNWLDVPAGLSQVGFIRFSVADDGNPAFPLNFELDAVSIASAALGGPTIPEPATIGLALGCLTAWADSRRRTIRPRG
jgi:hypothetical protein